MFDVYIESRDSGDKRPEVGGSESGWQRLGLKTRLWMYEVRDG